MTEDLSTIDALHPRRPWTVCFVGLCGGAGCTTTLASCAVDELLRGCFVLDLNLTQPGVHRLDQLAPPCKMHSGIVEYVRQYRSQGECPELPEFVYRAYDVIDMTLEEGDPPSLHEVLRSIIMPSGKCDEAYGRDVLSWDPDHLLGLERPDLFFTDLRLAAWEAFRCPWMLIDLPAGLAALRSVGLSCLADAVVFVVDASLRGLEWLPMLVKLMKSREEREERAIPRLYVLSRVLEVSEGSLDPDVLDRFSESIGALEDGLDTSARIRLRQEEEWGMADLPEFNIVDVDVVRFREKVRPFLQPSAYVQPAPERWVDGWWYPAHWIVETRNLVLQLKESEREARERARELIRKLNAYSDQEFGKALENDKLLERVRRIPSEILALLTNERRLRLYDRLHELRWTVGHRPRRKHQ